MSGPGDEDGGAGGSGADERGGGDGRGEWHVSEEFEHRLGCGLVTAVGVPAWFGLMALALGREASALAVVVAFVLFAISAAVGLPALRRLRRMPTSVVLEDGWLQLRGRGPTLALPVEMLAAVEVGANAGLESIRLHTHQGRTVRLPGDLDDVDGLIAALRADNPSITVTDHRGGRAA